MYRYLHIHWTLGTDANFDTQMDMDLNTKFFLNHGYKDGYYNTLYKLGLLLSLLIYYLMKLNTNLCEI